VVHAFINTDDSGDSNAEARDGDCLIIWRSDDIDGDGGATADAVNTALFVTYFDVSERDEVSARYGFQEWARRIDGNDELDEDVTTFGVATDGLCGEARWTNDGGGFPTGTSFGSYSYGDHTTAIEVFFRQNENNDGDLAVEDINFYSVRFNPSEVLDENIPLTPSSATRLGVNTFGASNSGTDSQETLVDVNAITYNNLLFTVVGCDDAAVGAFGTSDWGTVDADDDRTIQYYQFTLDTGTISGPTHIHPVTPDATDADENLVAFLSQDDYNTLWGDTFALIANSVYGSDEGLACAVIYYVAIAEEPSGNIAGNVLNNGDLFLAQISEVTGALIELAGLGVDDPDINDYQDMDWITTRISRNGDYIWVLAMRDTDQTVDELDVYASQYITTRPDDDGSFLIPPMSSTISSWINLSPDTDDSVEWFMFQDCLGYICGAQSDPDVMFVYFEESDLGPDDVFESVLTADIVTPCSPLTSTSLFNAFDNHDDQVNSNYVNDTTIFNAADAGHDGEIFTVYREDYDGTALGIDYRLTVEVSGPSGGIVELTSGFSFREFTMMEALVCTPAGDNIGVFDVVDLNEDPDRSHGAEEIHVLFRESESHQASGLGQALRTRVYRTDHDDATFGEQFTPIAAAGTFELPFDLDLPFVDPSTSRDASVVGIAVDGDTVGVWFTELSRVYYQEYDGNGGNSDDVRWLHDDGESDPLLVDDDNDEEIQGFTFFVTRSCTCETLRGAMVFWTKAFGSGSGGGFSERLQVRVRD
ncbi:MAG: hypothetical protein HUU15_14745, partial [Candidatus Brocadiae bacterium]|nr:hypothetical protein [Candidatus Brocadiia bacterium]